MNSRVVDVFAENVRRADSSLPLERVVISGDASKHRKKKERGSLCSLCGFGAHEPQSVDDAPVFTVLEQTDGRGVVSGNDPKRLFRFFDAFRHRNENGGFTTMTMRTPIVRSRFHVISVPGGSASVGKYSFKGGEIFVDLHGCELAVRADRLPRETCFTMECVSAAEAGMNRPFSLKSFAGQKVASDGLPRVAVSSWVPWHELARIENHFFRKGCYMLGRFASAPDCDDVAPSEMVYVGITGERDLKTRLSELYTSAMTHSCGHSGGCEFRRVCVSDRAKQYLDWPMPEDTYVRVISADCPTSKAHADAVRDLEARIIKQYVSRHGHLPLCNRKV